ncbi:MAG: hypothetical protein K2H85_02825, partial [Allobaculum sp.]|nr:hypothetical protein [Allobaculum sp.]
MNKIKVNDVVSAYARAINLDENLKKVLIQLMERIITKYERVVSGISVVDDPSQVYLIKPKNGMYSVEDFFLNRLMRNVWGVDFITPENVAENESYKHLKGKYDYDFLRVCLNMTKLKSQLERFKKELGSDFDEMNRRAYNKVIMHEFEHSLQSRFTDVLDSRFRDAYSRISDELDKIAAKYDMDLRSYESIPKEIPEFGTNIAVGTYYNHQNKEMPEGVYFGNRDSMDVLNEVLNETESLEMAQQNKFLRPVFNNDGDYYILRDPESSNGVISNYGDLIKIILGAPDAFKLMYIDAVPISVADTHLTLPT